MNILSYNPGHDGAIALLSDGRLVASLETEKNSRYRHSVLSAPDVFDALGRLEKLPDVLCRSGWWPSDALRSESRSLAGYFGIKRSDSVIGQTRMFGKQLTYFSSSHERSHLMCAFGMSDLPKGTPCYVLLWEGVIGSFYEIDSELNIEKVGDVMPEPGHRYSLLYGLADPSFDEASAEFSRFSDAGKLMALASYSTRAIATSEEERVIRFLMQDCAHLKPRECEVLKDCPYYNAGVEDFEFRNFAGIFSDRLFDRFYRFARAKMGKRLPLLITGGCGLNCDWNTKWRQTGLFSQVFVPPVANDSGSAIGTAVDAQFHFTGNPKIEWSVYSGFPFVTEGSIDETRFDEYQTDYSLIADMLAEDIILGWVNGRSEIGPRALGNRSILASPFHANATIRLNEIKQREQFRPIAPVCLDDDATTWFDGDQPSPFMLYTQKVLTASLAGVTHVNGTARIQTVSSESNASLHKLLMAFKARTGYGVLCNTSLNFKGRGFINSIVDLADYALERGLDGFVVEEKVYMVKSSKAYQRYRMDVGANCQDDKMDTST